MTRAKLQSLTRKELASLAKNRCIDGWHGMKKEELVDVLIADRRQASARPRAAQRRTVKVASSKRSTARSSTRSGAKNGRTARPDRRTTGANRGPKTNGLRRKLAVGSSERARQRKPLLVNSGSNGAPRDRLIITACDPYWLHVYWELKGTTLARAKTAMGLEWHQAVPVIRLFDASSDDVTRTTVTWLRDVEIEGDATNWFVQVDHPAKAYRVHIGYRAPSGKFIALARSDIVTTPRSGNKSFRSLLTEAVRSPNGSADFATNGESDSLTHRLPRPSLLAGARRSANAADDADGHQDFEFALHAELVVHGTTHPSAGLSLLGRRVALRPDGTFTQRVHLPNGRQVIPVVAVNPNGADQRTIVLAVERNTKELERKVFDEI